MKQRDDTTISKHEILTFQLCMTIFGLHICFHLNKKLLRNQIISNNKADYLLTGFKTQHFIKQNWYLIFTKFFTGYVQEFKRFLEALRRYYNI